MTNPHLFDNPDDYYDSFLQPWQLQLRNDMENGEIDDYVYEYIIKKNWDAFCEVVDEWYEQDLEDYYKALWEAKQEP